MNVPQSIESMAFMMNVNIFKFYIKWSLYELLQVKEDITSNCGKPSPIASIVYLFWVSLMRKLFACMEVWAQNWPTWIKFIVLWDLLKCLILVLFNPDLNEIIYFFLIYFPINNRNPLWSFMVRSRSWSSRMGW